MNIGRRKKRKKEKKEEGQADLIIRILLGLVSLGSKPDYVSPEAIIKGSLELDIDRVFQGRSIVPAIAGHVAGRVNKDSGCERIRYRPDGGFEKKVK